VKPKPLIISLLAFIITSTTTAQQFVPFSSNLQLPTLPPGAREMGLGGVGTAGTGNSFSVYYNPADLSLRNFSVGVDGINFPWLRTLPYAKVSYQFYGVYGAYKIPNLFALGAFFAQHSFSITYNSIPDYSNPEYLAGIALARDFSSVLSGGITIKFGKNTIKYAAPPYRPEATLERSASLFALDVGLLFRQVTPAPLLGSLSNSTGLNVGAVFKEIGPKYTYFSGTGQDNPLPSNMRFGVSYGWLNQDDLSSTLVLDFVKYLNDQTFRGPDKTYAWFNAIFRGWTDQSLSDELRHISYLTGVEVGYREVVFLRLGRGRDFTPAINTWSVGIGGKYFGLGADVAFVSKKYIYLDPRAYNDTSDSGLRFTLSYQR